MIDDIKKEEEEDDDDDDGTKHENTPLRLQSKGGPTVLFSNPRCCYIRCMYKDITKKQNSNAISYPKKKTQAKKIDRHDDHFTCAKKDASHLLPVLFSSTPVVFVRGFLF